MDEPIEEFTVGNETLKIYHHDNADPREWDNLSQMIFTGSWKHLGDKHDVNFDGGFDSRQHFIDGGELAVRKQLKDVVICKPVHLYNHSGITISTSYSYPYNCRWDSGTCGFLVVTKQDIRDNWNIKRVTQHYIDWAEKIAEAELKTLDQAVRGEVYGFVHEKEIEIEREINGEINGEIEIEVIVETIDSCWGFYGDDWMKNGMTDHVDEKFHEALSNA